MAIGTRCPDCGANTARLSRFRGLSERLRGLFGAYPVRCQKCGRRFETAIWLARSIHYARCPKCYRMELSTWSEQYYNSPGWIILQLRLGATPYRCEFCRCNFASFRPFKERFSWRNRRTATPAATGG